MHAQGPTMEQFGKTLHHPESTAKWVGRQQESPSSEAQPKLTLMLRPAFALVSMKCTLHSLALPSPSSIDTCLHVFWHRTSWLRQGSAVVCNSLEKAAGSTLVHVEHPCATAKLTVTDGPARLGGLHPRGTRPRQTYDSHALQL